MSSCGILYFFDNPQLGATGSRVLVDFCFAGGDGVCCQELENAARIAAWRCPLWAVNPLAALLSEVDLGDPVLKRVEREDGEACPRSEEGRDFKQSFPQSMELIIHMNS